MATHSDDIFRRTFMCLSNKRNEKKLVTTKYSHELFHSSQTTIFMYDQIATENRYSIFFECK